MLNSLSENSAKNVDSSDKSDKKTSHKKSDDNSKSDLENIMKTSKETVS